ncbi:RNA-binding domain-containing protein [Agrococcus sp. KRD186]|jgi:ATP-dependent DNA helicase RecG|uniref:RNA-binding domain-containing protein n=1 Tax=Agrococcus sp. KRD186 TaxID=2729730 RepID=UPI0019D01C02|nr:crosslink repair DNA glycosylase YcaQ family protein [Agrococcus sp. KRD186]
MEERELRELIAGGETMTVEFKRATTLSDLSDRDLSIALACLANGDGGVLLMGVEDDGRITGVGDRHMTTTDISRLRLEVARQTEPALQVDIAEHELDGETVLRLTVPASQIPVSVGGRFTRRGRRRDGQPECVPMGIAELQSIALTASGIDYMDRIVVGARWEDLDPAEFERFRRLARAAQGDAGLVQLSDRDIARALRAIRIRGDVEDVTLGGIALFGTADALERHLPSSRAQFQVLRGTEVVVNEERTGTVLELVEWLGHQVEQRNEEHEITVGLIRLPVSRINRRAVREAVANALVHRDYLEPGAISVRLTDTELVVVSPGGLPRGVTLDSMLEASQPRSAMLAGALKRAGVVELAGRGVEVMFEELLRAGRDEPDYSRTAERSVTVALDASAPDRAIVRFVTALDNERSTPLSRIELQVVHALRDAGAASMVDLESMLSAHASRLRGVVRRMTEAGVIEVRGSGSRRDYHLAARFYRMADEGTAGVRISDIDAVRHPHLVLELIDRNGAVTRSDVAKLCGLSPEQASALLKRMVRAGQLLQLGQKRGTTYVRSDG